MTVSTAALYIFLTSDGLCQPVRPDDWFRPNEGGLPLGGGGRGPVRRWGEEPQVLEKNGNITTLIRGPIHDYIMSTNDRTPLALAK